MISGEERCSARPMGSFSFSDAKSSSSMGSTPLRGRGACIMRDMCRVAGKQRLETKWREVQSLPRIGIGATVSTGTIMLYTFRRPWANTATQRSAAAFQRRG